MPKIILGQESSSHSTDRNHLVSHFSGEEDNSYILVGLVGVNLSPRRSEFGNSQILLYFSEKRYRENIASFRTLIDDYIFPTILVTESRNFFPILLWEIHSRTIPYSGKQSIMMGNRVVKEFISKIVS